MIGKDKTESPIEKMLYESLQGWERLEGIPNLDVEMQREFGEYRVDFGFFFGSRLVLVVECDGHDFHEKTKDQAKRDKSRDRWFLNEFDVPTIRFTGSEIFAKAEDCAREAISIANALAAEVAYSEWLMSRKTLGAAA